MLEVETGRFSLHLVGAAEPRGAHGILWEAFSARPP